MRGIPFKVKVVVGDPLPLHRLEILKELVRKAALGLQILIFMGS